MMKYIQSARELGYSHLYLETFPLFAKAVSMYERLGFKRLEHSLGHSSHCACNIWMLKKLDE